jgi:hypothetical protein
MKKSFAALPILLLASHANADTYLAAIGIADQQGAACPNVVGSTYNGIVEYNGPGSTTATIRAVLAGATWPVPVVVESVLTITNQITSEHVKGNFTVTFSDNPIGNAASGTFDAKFKMFKKDSLTATIDWSAPAFGCSVTWHLAMTRIGK